MAEGGGGPSGLQDDELYLPRTVVNKLIKEIVPNIRVTNDARDLLLNCCTEFIHLIASEASDISEQQQKKVISPEHVVEALNTLGFQEYVADVEAVHKEYKEQASKHRKRGKSKLDRLGIPEEELLRQQQQLFEEARQQQMESELLEHQRAQQQQQQQQQLQQQPPTLPQQTSLQPQPQQQTITQQPPVQASLPHLTSTHHQSPSHQAQIQPPTAAVAHSTPPMAVSSLVSATPPAPAPTAAPVVGSVPIPRGVFSHDATAVRSAVAGQPVVAGGDAQVKSVAVATTAVQRPAVHQAQSINTAGLNMLAAVGARQQLQEQQLLQQQLQQQHQQQQATGITQPAPAKGPPPLLPNNAAITVASLQATSSLLQQALAMASAQVAANSTAQQQRQPVTTGAPSSVLGGATGAALPLPQSLLLQQQALAALAAQQVQMGSQLGHQLGGQATKVPFIAPAGTSQAMAAPIPGLGAAGVNFQGASNQGAATGSSGMELGHLESKVFPPT